MTTLAIPARRLRLVKYLAIANVSLRQRLRDRLVLGARVAFLALVMFVYARLWRELLPGHAAGASAPSAVESVWYLAITEWVVIGQPRLHLSIERDVRSGDLAYQLNRPMSYLTFKLAEAIGELAASMLTLGCAGALFAYLFAGGFPTDPRGLWWALPLGLIAAVLTMLWHALIGLSSFWLTDCNPIYLVWQKSMFVLGGLFVPLALYPEWLLGLARWTPFPVLIHGPGSMAFGSDPALALHTLGLLMLWSAVAVVLLSVVYRRGLKSVELHGG